MIFDQSECAILTDGFGRDGQSHRIVWRDCMCLCVLVCACVCLYVLVCACARTLLFNTGVSLGAYHLV